ncbi:DUF3768 domain-containing protein [Novosphingobium sp. B 225]|uniref:DUF3768 domain-containing protein n=1 Tax=Novosphingobium sp. B 225 TaxID=1961849 RepID=UPI0034E97560
MVETFDAFTPDNDPSEEPDFGAIYKVSDGLCASADERDCDRKGILEDRCLRSRFALR